MNHQEEWNVLSHSSMMNNFIVIFNLEHFYDMFSTVQNQKNK